MKGIRGWIVNDDDKASQGQKEMMRNNDSDESYRWILTVEELRHNVSFNAIELRRLNFDANKDDDDDNNNNDDDTASKVIEFIEKSNSSKQQQEKRIWNTLVLSRCDGAMDRVLNPLLTRNQIKKLHIELLINDYACRSLGIQLQQTTFLTSLSLFCITLTQTQLIDLSKGIGFANTTLEEVVFGRVKLASTAMTNLTDAFSSNKHLKKISMFHCQLQDEQIKEIVASLVSHPELEDLTLATNSCGLHGLAEMNKLLQFSTETLQHLDLSNLFMNNIFNDPIIQKVSFLDLTTSLKSNNHMSLRSLNLSGNDLDDSSMVALAKVLHYVPNLVTLDLFENNLTNDGISLLVNVLHSCGLQKLKSLYLSRNPFDEDGSEMLYNALKGHVEIESITISGLCAHSESSKDLKDLMNFNRGGRRLLRERIMEEEENSCSYRPSPLPLSLWPYILERAIWRAKYYGPDDLFQRPSNSEDRFEANVIYHLLRGPVLFQRM